MTEIKLELSAPLAWVAALRDLHDQIDGASVSPLSQLADMIEEQVKPAIEEPTEFGSIVSAPLEGERVLWTPNPRVGRHYWISATGFSEVWSELTDVEVLRVGLGPEPLAEWESDLLNQQARRDIAAAVLSAMDVDQYLIDAVVNARPR